MSQSFPIPIKEGNTDMVKYFLARGIKPDRFDFGEAMNLRNIEIIDALINGGAVPFHEHVDEAIRIGNPKLVKDISETSLKHFIKNGNINPSRLDLAYANSRTKSINFNPLIKGQSVRLFSFNLSQGLL